MSESSPNATVARMHQLPPVPFGPLAPNEANGSQLQPEAVPNSTEAPRQTATSETAEPTLGPPAGTSVPTDNEVSPDAKMSEYAEIQGIVLNYGFASKAGPNKDEKGNQDRILRDPSTGAFAVIAGIGDIKGGAVAAETVQSSLQAYFQVHSGELTLETAGNHMKAAFLAAHDEVEKKANETGHPGIGAVATAVIPFKNNDGESYVAIGHVGNTRMYVQPDFSDTIHQITNDETQDTPGQHNVLTNAIADGFNMQLEQFAVAPLRNNLRLMLCTEGITGNEEIHKIGDDQFKAAFEMASPQAAADRFLETSTKPDDESVLIVDVVSLPDSKPGETPTSPAAPTDVTSPIIATPSKVKPEAVKPGAKEPDLSNDLPPIDESLYKDLSDEDREDVDNFIAELEARMPKRSTLTDTDILQKGYPGAPTDAEILRMGHTTNAKKFRYYIDRMNRSTNSLSASQRAFDKENQAGWPSLAPDIKDKNIRPRRRVRSLFYLGRQGIEAVQKRQQSDEQAKAAAQPPTQTVAEDKNKKDQAQPQRPVRTILHLGRQAATKVVKKGWQETQSRRQQLKLRQEAKVSNPPQPEAGDNQKAS